MDSINIPLTKLSDCGGCGGKIGAGTLSSLLNSVSSVSDPNLLVGFDKNDDASVYQISPELALVQTLDFFPPIHDNPFIYGQIAAANALSDVYAMGAEPKTAQNILCVPKKMHPSVLQEILQGGLKKVHEAGAILTGGHSIYDEIPKYGLSVTGFIHPQKVLSNAGAQPGDVLFLTKPIGVGVLTTAQKGDLLSEKSANKLVDLMTTLNKSARDIMINFQVHACTDITGFGLLGHALEMAKSSDVQIELAIKQVDFIPEALEFAEMGMIPRVAYENRAFCEKSIQIGSTQRKEVDLLYDPQTSGGLLISVDKKDADGLEKALKGMVPSTQRIGVVVAYQGKKRIFLH